jgi:ribonuclease P protein component
MIAHKFRFHGHGSLRYVYRNGRAVRSRHMSLRYTKNDQRVHSRVAVIVSKKVYKQAARRNRIRRRIFEVIRHTMGDMPEAYDISLTVHSPEVMVLPHDQLKEEILSLLGMAEVVKKDSDTMI